MYLVLFWPKTDVPENNSGRECCWPYLIGQHPLSPVFGQKRPGTPGKGGSYGNKILYKNLDLTQDFPNKISFHFLWVKILPKNLPKIFKWPEMCPLDKILAQDFQMAAFTKILRRRDTSIVPLLSTENCKTLF